MSAPAPRADGVWYRTRARPGSRDCDACHHPVAAGEPIAYRRRGRRSDLLHKKCAENEPYVTDDHVETDRPIWDEARQATTPEARGQRHLAAAPKPDEPQPTRAELLEVHLRDELEAAAALEEALTEMEAAGAKVSERMLAFRRAAERTERVRRLDDGADE